jgi:hypothetical protein
MTVRAVRFVVALALLIVAGLFLNAGNATGEAGNSEPGPMQEGTTESLSPSQEAQAKINELRRNEFFYQSYGKADPFRPLVSGDFEQITSSEIADLSSARLVGVMWGEDDRFALVEDGEGFGYILRVGDRVRNGRVVSIRKSSLTARITLYGITSKVVLRLEKTEG